MVISFPIILLKMMMIKPCRRRNLSGNQLDRQRRPRVRPYMIKLWTKIRRDLRGGAEMWVGKQLKIWK